MTEFAKTLSAKRFDVLLELSSWMQSQHNALIDTNPCDEAYLGIQDEGEELAEAITENGFTYEQVETFAFDLAE